MPFSARTWQSSVAASIKAGLLPGPDAQYTQIDLIVLMGEGCGAPQRVRQVAGWHTRAQRVARRAKRNPRLPQQGEVVRHFPPLTRVMNVGPPRRQDESGPTQFGMIAVRKVSI